MKTRLIDEIYPGFTERSDRGRKNRAKGVAFERALAKKLRSLWPEAKRLFGQARQGDECPDVGGTPFWLELGKGGVALHTKLIQAISDSSTSPNPQYKGLPPVAIVEHKSGHTMVGMELQLFMQLMLALKTENLALAAVCGPDVKKKRARKPRKKASSPIR